MAYWNNSATEIDKMTVKEWLDKMTNENWHSERMVVEAFIDGREQHMITAVLIWLMHLTMGICRMSCLSCVINYIRR